jgi:hypothetical protein
MGKSPGKSELIAKCLGDYLFVTCFEQLALPICLVNITLYTGAAFYVNIWLRPISIQSSPNNRPFFLFCLGELFYARRFPIGWSELSFDDGDWRMAKLALAMHVGAWPA